MDDAALAALAHDPAARAQWVHDLRNAVNTLGVGTRVSQRLLEKGRVDEACDTLAQGMRAWERCRDLLAHASVATALAAAPPPARGREDTVQRRD